MNIIEAAVRTVMKFVGDSISPVGGMDRTAGVGGWVSWPAEVAELSRKENTQIGV